MEFWNTSEGQEHIVFERDYMFVPSRSSIVSIPYVYLHTGNSPTLYIVMCVMSMEGDSITINTIPIETENMEASRKVWIQYGENDNPIKVTGGVWTKEKGDILSRSMSDGTEITVYDIIEPLSNPNVGETPGSLARMPYYNLSDELFIVFSEELNNIENNEKCLYHGGRENYFDSSYETNDVSAVMQINQE